MKERYAFSLLGWLPHLDWRLICHRLPKGVRQPSHRQVAVPACE